MLEYGYVVVVEPRCCFDIFLGDVPAVSKELKIQISLKPYSRAFSSQCSILNRSKDSPHCWLKV